MLQENSMLGAIRRQIWPFASTAAIVATLLLAGGAAWAQDSMAKKKPETAVRLLFTVPIPPAPTNTTGGMYAFDISFVDQSNQTYYLGDRSNQAVTVVDAKTGTFVQHITATPPFAGVQLNAAGTAVNNNISGPNGVATDGAGTCLFAGDGPSRVVSFTIPSGTQVSSVSTGGMFRADEMAFDPKDRLLLVVNNADTPPFATLISVSTTCALTVGKKIIFDTLPGDSGVNATNGAEQSAWDPATQRFYESIPSISGTIATPGPMGALIRINALTATVDAIFSVPYCMPAGLSLNPTNQTFLQGCSVVYDTAGVAWFGADTNSANPSQVIIDVNGVFAFVNGVGSSDEVWYNAGDNHWYTGTSNSPYSAHPVASTSGATSTTDQAAAILGVIDGTSQTLDQIVPTINVPLVSPPLGPPPGHPNGSSHSVAANGANNWVFVPHPANNAIPGCLTGCIGVYGRDDADLTGAND
jgi:hypothetical protein